MNTNPAGEERTYQKVGGITIDGAPVTYVVTLAAVVAALSFIPLSVVIGSGKSFPMSQGVYPLVGWILGPLAGALANAVGAIIGVFIAPHTTTMPAATVAGAAMGGLVAGSMTLANKRRWWWLPLFVLLLGAYAFYGSWAILVIQVRWGAVIAGSSIDWSALLLFLLPTRALVPRWIGSRDLKLVSLGLFFGTWITAGLTHLTASTIIYPFFNWPEAVWLSIAPIAPLEHLIRCLVGTLLGTGLIAGLRAIGLVKARYAAY